MVQVSITRLFGHTDGKALSAQESRDQNTTQDTTNTDADVLACQRRARESDPACHGDVLAAVIDALRPADTDTTGGEQA